MRRQFRPVGGGRRKGENTFVLVLSSGDTSLPPQGWAEAWELCKTQPSESLPRTASTWLEKVGVHSGKLANPAQRPDSHKQ